MRAKSWRSPKKKQPSLSRNSTFSKTIKSYTSCWSVSFVPAERSALFLQRRTPKTISLKTRFHPAVAMRETPTMECSQTVAMEQTWTITSGLKHFRKSRLVASCTYIEVWLLGMALFRYEYRFKLDSLSNLATLK